MPRGQSINMRRGVGESMTAEPALDCAGRFRHTYLLLLRARLSSTESHLAKANELFELWNHELESQTSPFVIRELEALLANVVVDISELGVDKGRILRQIGFEEEEPTVSVV